MSTQSRLDSLLLHPPLTLPCPEKAVFFSDLHMGDGGPADDFWPNHELACKTLIRYRDEGYEIFLLGDTWELLQFSKTEIDQRYVFLGQFLNTAYWIAGNHDPEIGHSLCKAILLTGDKPILLVHGHQGDWWNDNNWWFTKIAVKYLWKTLEYIGFQDEWLSAAKGKRHDRVRKALIEWANDRKVTLVHGHVHTLENNGYEWDCGSQVTPGKVECVELVNGVLSLKRWG